MRDVREVAKRIVATVYNNLDSDDAPNHRPVWMTSRAGIEEMAAVMISGLLEEQEIELDTKWSESMRWGS